MESRRNKLICYSMNKYYKNRFTSTNSKICTCIHVRKLIVDHLSVKTIVHILCNFIWILNKSYLNRLDIVVHFFNFFFWKSGGVFWKFTFCNKDRFDELFTHIKASRLSYFIMVSDIYYTLDYYQGIILKRKNAMFEKCFQYILCLNCPPLC